MKPKILNGIKIIDHNSIPINAQQASHNNSVDANIGYVNGIKVSGLQKACAALKVLMRNPFPVYARHKI